jgi:hypothetical protein
MEAGEFWKGMQQLMDRQAEGQAMVLDTVVSEMDARMRGGMERPNRLNGLQALPEFSGAPNEDLGGWLFVVEQTFEAMGGRGGLEEKNMVAGAASRLRGAAMQWYRRLVTSCGAPLRWMNP